MLGSAFVCSVISQYCPETDKQIKLTFSTKGCHQHTHTHIHTQPFNGLLTTTTMYYKGIWVSPKIMVLPSGTMSQTLDL